MTKKLLLGVEAIGQGAIDGGMSGVYAPVFRTFFKMPLNPLILLD